MNKTQKLTSKPREVKCLVWALTCVFHAGSHSSYRGMTSKLFCILSHDDAFLLKEIKDHCWELLFQWSNGKMMYSLQRILGQKPRVLLRLLVRQVIYSFLITSLKLISWYSWRWEGINIWSSWWSWWVHERLLGQKSSRLQAVQEKRRENDRHKGDWVSKWERKSLETTWASSLIRERQEACIMMIMTPT